MNIKAKLLASAKIWLAIYPSITLFLFVFGRSLSALPLAARTLILTLSLVPWIVFVGVPFIDSIFRFFSSERKQVNFNDQKNQA